MAETRYSAAHETQRLLNLVLDSFASDRLSLPDRARSRAKANVSFRTSRDLPYFPIPFKQTETTAALKAVEAGAAAALVDLRNGADVQRRITVDLEKTTAFLFQAYLATVGGLGKLDPGVRDLLKDTDLLQAQSDPYRRMSANLYETKRPGEYYHIHGSLEASTTLRMIGLEPFRPDLKTHQDISSTIEAAVKHFTVEKLEQMNAENRQAGVLVLTHADFLKTPHGSVISQNTPWSVVPLEESTAPCPLPAADDNRPLSGIKVLELCRIIAGPTITRILAEYGATVLKITSPNLSDVPFFQVDGNMGKHAADLDLKTPNGRADFEKLVAEADVVVDGYRPGALEKLGYGPRALSKLAEQRGRGVVYVNENCFGYEGEWAYRPGWQQIADCVTGVAWEQGHFMGLSEPVVPPFPISDYGTGCMGAIAALAGLVNRTERGGSWHGRTSLVQYDLLLFRAGAYPGDVVARLRDESVAWPDFGQLRHDNSVDQISGVVLRGMRRQFPELFARADLMDSWFSEKYAAEVKVVAPVVEIEGAEMSFRRASRPNGSDPATWEFGEERDYRTEGLGGGMKEC